MKKVNSEPRTCIGAKNDCKLNVVSLLKMVFSALHTRLHDDRVEWGAGGI